MIDFKLNIEPPTITAQQKGVDFKRKRFYTKEEVRRVHMMLCTLMAAHRPAAMLRGPLVAEVIVTYPWRARDNRDIGWQPKDTSPDCDNIGKMIFDCLQDVGFYKNDSQIARQTVGKGWGDQPGIRVKLKEWDW
jgi:Holliday junction resolvase RusA-like endonuclease